MKKEDYDIVVIGAGPSGCVAAMKLAHRFRVLLLERCRLPRVKSCSGVLIRKSVELVEKHVGKIPERVCCTPFVTSGLTVITSSRSCDFRDAGVNVVRADFDNWLAESARERGVVVRDGALVSGIAEGDPCRVTFSHNGVAQTVRARLVVAADGVNGSSRRLLGLPQQKKVVTFQKFYRGTIDGDPGRFYAYTSPEFSRYDAWFNSKNGMIVAGSIAANRTEAEMFQSRFVRHLEKTRGLAIEAEEKTEVWTLPLIAPRPDILLGRGRILFTGEAAGLLNPFGEGMSIGMTASLALAEACLSRGLDDPQGGLALYRELVTPEVAYMFRQWAFLRELSPEFRENVAQF